MQPSPNNLVSILMSSKGLFIFYYYLQASLASHRHEVHKTQSDLNNQWGKL